MITCKMLGAKFDSNYRFLNLINPYPAHASQNFQWKQGKLHTEFPYKEHPY